MWESEIFESLSVVEQLLEVGSDWIMTQVQGQERAEAHEDVVGEDGESVVGEGEGDELESVGEHGGVEVLDLIVGQVQVSQWLGDVRQSRVGHHLELVVAEVESLQLAVPEGVAGQRAEPGKYLRLKTILGGEYFMME